MEKFRTEQGGAGPTPAPAAYKGIASQGFAGIIRRETFLTTTGYGRIKSISTD
jgi:hypothetical protein